MRPRPLLDEHGRPVLWATPLARHDATEGVDGARGCATAAAIVVVLIGGSVFAGLVPGGGPAESDCLVEADVEGIRNVAGQVAKNRIVSCTDGEACDQGVCGDDTCVLAVRVCVNQQDATLGACTPPASLDRVKVKGKVGVEPPASLEGAVCGPVASVPVKVKKNKKGTKKKPGRVAFGLSGRAPAGTEPRTDNDRVVLRCLPRTGACPTTTTTTLAECQTDEDCLDRPPAGTFACRTGRCVPELPPECDPSSVETLGDVPSGRTAPRAFVTANDVVLQQGQTLPVFRLSAPGVTAGTTQGLAGRLSGVGDRPAVQDEYLGRTRFTVPNEGTRSLLTRYGASGGFYAFNLGALGSDTSLGPVDRATAELLACRFLDRNGLMDGQGNLLLENEALQGVATPNPQGCDFTPDPNKPRYRTRLVRAAALDAAAPAAPATEQIVGVVVEVPMAIPLPAGSVADALPLAGPGGHLSLLFTTTAPGNALSLDGEVPGLTAVAMPFFSREVTRLGDVPIDDPNTLVDRVRQQVRAAYPEASSITVPDPRVVYYVSDAAVEQRVLEPVLEFTGIEVTIGGETVVLRGIPVPLLEGGAGGFGPTVRITDPSRCARFKPGADVTLRGEVRNGRAPYRVEWIDGEGGTLQETTLESPGTVEVTTDDLPAASRDGTRGRTTVTLRVTDDEGAVRLDRITLVPLDASPPRSTMSGGRGVGVSSGRTRPRATVRPAPRSTGYSFGIESVSDYPPTGTLNLPGDLPGVIPDARGFRDGMIRYGYSRAFSWNEGLAWERDWRDCGLGGIDCAAGVDRADFVYFAGHGGPAGILLASAKDGRWFLAQNARFQTLRWVGFASCQTLRVQGFAAGLEPIRQWFNAFQGAHLLLGFNSNMRDLPFGGRLVDNMRLPTFLGIEFPWAQQTIAQAWINTTFQLGAGSPAFIYARSAGANPANDKLPKPGQAMPPRPTPVTSYHWVWWEF